MKFYPGSRVINALLLLASILLCAGCEGPMPGRFTRVSEPCAAKPNDYRVEVLDTLPSRPYTEIARLDVHMEEAFFAQPALKDMMPELLRQARLAGADAIINVKERKSVINETRSLHVTATGIKFTQAP